jgi:hypothetical protein
MILIIHHLFWLKIGSFVVCFHPLIHFLMLQLDEHYIFLDFKKSIIINGKKIFIKNNLAKMFIIKLLVLIQVSINISKDILITIHIWAKGT